MEVTLIGYARRNSGAAVSLFSRIISCTLYRVLFVCLLFITFPGQAAQVVLDEIKVHEEDDATSIEIFFGLPLRYLKHFPQKMGEIVQIQLELGLDEGERRDRHKEVREGGELLSPEGQESVLVYVTYEEGVPGGPYLTLRFSHMVRFDVLSGPDRKSLSVKVYHDDPSQKNKLIDIKKSQQSNIDLMMAKARQAITFGNNKGAIDQLRKIIRSPKHSHSQQANELLGLALERDKQIPRAKYEYKKYLKRYPKGDGADRVKKRLAALRNVRVKAKRKLRRSRAVRNRSQFITFGRFTQYYSEYYLDRELEGEAEDLEQELQQQLLSTNFSIKSRYRGEDRTIQAIFNASHRYDFLAGDEGREDDDKSEADIRRMYIDIDDSLYGFKGRIGRQSSRNGGVFGTFDGIVAGYRVAPQWTVSAVAGEPLIRTFTDVEVPEKFFYGLKADVVSKDKSLGSNMYFVQQDVDGILDRQALGGDVRFAKKGLSIFGLLDYDVSYSEISLINVRVGWNYTESNKLNFSYNRRNLLFTSLALRGMSGIFTIEQLLGYLPESEIRRIAKERTVVNQTLTVGNSYQLNKDQQVNLDVTVLTSSGSPEGVNPLKVQQQIDDPTATISTAIFAQESRGYELIYALQWISSNTFVSRDLYVAGLRHSDFESYTDTSLFINARLPLQKKWRLGIRLNISDRNSSSFGKRTTVSPVFKLNYRLSKAWSFDSELGLDFVDNTEQPDEVRRRLRLSYSYTF
ncbi:MAG: hypothetical protein COB30_007635 [Ectothiorhodospiraceae bacterium]|nr:hypothetical protein [Ectothiorhodospiraceae bacterium]